MLVILIIGVLIAMLLPAISAATVYFKITDTQNRITMLSGYIEQYKQVFGDYPPSHLTIATTPILYQTLTPNSWLDQGVPPYSHAVDINNYSGLDGPPIGGGFLYYFMLGPNQAGWSTTDSSVSFPVVSANWQAPDSLAKIVYWSQPIVTPNASNGEITGGSTAACHAMYYFEDGFGCAGYMQGTIQYSLRLTRAMMWPGSSTLLPAGSWYSRDMDGAYKDSSNLWGGGGDGCVSWQRLTSQCPGPYILLSAGPDRIFGYVITDPTTGGKRPVNGPNVTAPSTPDPSPLTNGVSDDVTNFAHN
jgi:type II secretory pathway pseudopilin PulG